MKTLPERCQVVKSVKGRDKGKFYMVFDHLDAQFVLTVDGSSRKINKPKKKKVKHLSPESVCLEGIREKLEEGLSLTDAEVRRALKDAGFAASDREKEA